MESPLFVAQAEPGLYAATPDGYLRMRLADLQPLDFEHLLSYHDAGLCAELLALGMPARLAGFTEWASVSTPAVSLAWGWYVASRSRAVLLAPDGVRSNVMLIDAQGYDLGPKRTSELLHAWLHGLPWRSDVAMAIRGAPAC